LELVEAVVEAVVPPSFPLLPGPPVLEQALEELQLLEAVAQVPEPQLLEALEAVGLLLQPVEAVQLLPSWTAESIRMPKGKALLLEPEAKDRTISLSSLYPPCDE
jgi:hypothetical protein